MAKLAPTIFDRVPFISEPVYKRARGEPMFLPVELLHLRLARMNPVLVFCQGQSGETISGAPKAHKPAEHLARVKETFPIILEGYDQQMKILRKEGFTILLYDWTRDDYDDFLKAVLLCVG